MPTAELISKPYADERRKLIDMDKALTDVPAGDPKLGQADTIYLCVVDKDRNCVSLIQSNYYGFGSRLVPGDLGFALAEPRHAVRARRRSTSTAWSRTSGRSTRSSRRW